MKTLIFPDDIDYQQGRVDKIVESSVNNFFNSSDGRLFRKIRRKIHFTVILSKVEEDLFDKISSFSNSEDI